MKHLRGLALAALILGASGVATAQPKPTTSAQPKAEASAKPSASASAGALPPGHPPVGEASAKPAAGALPPGHPAVNEDEEPSPHGKGGRGTGAGGFFSPPEDTAQDDPSLPAGVIVAIIKDAQDKPIAHAPVTLGILHSSVAKGESRQRQARETDDAGTVRFEGLGSGSGITYRVSTTRGPATYAHTPFALGDKAGKRVVVHSYEVSGNIEELAVGMQGLVYVSLREDSIQVEHLLSVFNLGPVSWTANVPIALPKGWKAFNKQDSMDDGHVEEVAGSGAALRGTFSPGRHEINFRYQVPLDDEARQTLHIQLPPRVAQARVMAEASKTMGLEVAGFPEAQRTQGRDGKRLLITELQASRQAGGVTALDITLSGLPTPGPGRWVAVVLAALALATGLYYLSQQRTDGTLDADARDELIEAREALLGEIVALERAHKSGEVGPKTYARIRASLLDALARIVTMLEKSRLVRNQRRAARRSEPAT